MEDWTLSNIFLISLVVMFIYYCLCYVVAWLRDDLSVIDIAWPFSFLVLVTFWFLSGDGQSFLTPFFLCYLLVMLWSLRLGLYLLFRNLKKGEEDYRYRQWRESNGPHAFIKAFPLVYMVQMILMIVISSPLLMMIKESPDLWKRPEIYFLGLGVSLIGILYQSVADFQLDRFKKSSKRSCVLRQGLWKLSRHPNYFGEMLMWWGVFILVSSTLTQPLDMFMITVSPLCITYLLVKVTGAPLIEKRYSENREYQLYIEQTNKFIPSIRRIFNSKEIEND